MSEATGASRVRRIFKIGRGRYLVALAITAVAIGAIALNPEWLSYVTSPLSSSVVAETVLENEVRSMPVRAKQVHRVEQISQKRQYTGVIRAGQQADLGFELTGRVDRVLVDEGDFVQTGAPMAFLDIQALKARRAATVASLNQANARLDELKAGPRVERIDGMRARLRQAESNRKLANLNFERRSRLHNSGAISLEEFEQALYGQKSAEAEVETVQRQLDEMVAGTRPEIIAAQQASIAQLQATVAEIDIQIEKSEIRAPFSGKVVERMADPGGIATASTPILKLVEVENLEALVGIPAEQARSLIRDSEFTVVVAGQTYTATLLAKIQQLEAATRTQKVIFQLGSEANGVVIPGQLCQIEIASKIQTEGYWVPASSLTNGIRGLWSLLVVNPEDNRALRRDVEVIYTDGDRALVRGTLQDGAHVITAGTHRIVEGQAVEIVSDLTDKAE